MPPPQRNEPFSASYFSELVGSARVRYEGKVQVCDDSDPYTLRLGVDTTMEADVLPAVTHGDIVNYLVYCSSFVTLEEMKAFKSLEAHNYFTSGWVRSQSAVRLQDEKVLLLGEVNHSQRLSDHPHKAWILCKTNGTVLVAHCTCMAGTGETCPHVGACLFAAETAVRIRNSVSCTQKENTWLPAYVEKLIAYHSIRLGGSPEERRPLRATTGCPKGLRQGGGPNLPNPTWVQPATATGTP
ncbi:uncharacterized protein LOC144109884 [Amblyomma americanum]